MGLQAAIAGLGLLEGRKAKKDQRAAQERSLAEQRATQEENNRQAASQNRKSQMEMNKANRKTPDLMGIMDRAEADSMSGIGSTLLTGTAGVDPNALKLSRKTLLGS